MTTLSYSPTFSGNQPRRKWQIKDAFVVLQKATVFAITSTGLQLFATACTTLKIKTSIIIMNPGHDQA